MKNTKNKKVLITGGAGFIGSHLGRELLDQGYTVRIMDNFSPQVHGDKGGVPEILGNEVEVFEGDVRSKRDLNLALDGVDMVVHFAAAVGVGQSMYEVANYVDVNNMGTATLLQTLLDRRHDRPIEKLLVASSMSIYGEGLYKSESGQDYSEVTRDLDRIRFRDFDPKDEQGKALKALPTPESKRPDLNSIYALNKYDQERMCLLIGQAYKIPTVAMRFFNVYGRGQALSNPYTGVLAIFGSRLINNQPPMIFEDGQQLRDFVHVSDVARACRMALEEPKADGQTLNIGSGQVNTVTMLAEKLARALGKEEIKPEVTGKFRVGDVRHCFPDITRAREVLGFEPKVDIDKGIQDLGEWLKEQKAEDRYSKMQAELATNGLAI